MKDVDQPKLVDTVRELELKTAEVGRLHTYLIGELNRMDTSKREEAAKVRLFQQASYIWFLEKKAVQAVVVYADRYGWGNTLKTVAERPDVFGSLKGWDVPGFGPGPARQRALNEAKLVATTLKYPTEMTSAISQAKSVEKALGQAVSKSKEIAEVLKPVIQQITLEREQQLEQERQREALEQGLLQDRGGISY